MLLAALLTGSTPPELQKHRGLDRVKKLLNANYPNMPPCVKMRSETTQMFKAKHKHSSELWASLYMPWTNPGASQSLPGSRVREASLSTADSSPQPASPSLWKVSFNHCGGGGGGEGGWSRGDSGVGGEGSD